MTKKPRDFQLEMLLPISGKDTVSISKKTRTVSYTKVVESLRRKGLTRALPKK